MDRRQKKSREAIFRAFMQLLSEKDFSKITAGEIIQRADVGRATFYAHFETKDYLLRELNRELFCHVFDTVGENPEHSHIFACDAPDSVFLHLFQHLSRNDNHILELLSCRNNDLFLQYFQSELILLIENCYESIASGKAPELPKDFWIHHAAATFVDTICWWIRAGQKQTPEELCKYYLLALNIA